jgi:GntR family transcriptional regulator, transcriptional repressor for pyruvate dehydrogenase complex
MSVSKDDLRDELFDRAQPVRAFEDVVRQIRAAIVEGRLVAGDRLPSQRELQARFAVGRNVILEAIRILETRGLVEVRRGAHGGAIVRRLDAGPLSEHLSTLFGQEAMPLNELVEFREALEGQNAAWATLRADEDDLAALVEIRDDLRRLVADGAPHRAIMKQDNLLHAVLARAAHNRASSAVREGIIATFQEALASVDPPPDFAEQTAQDVSDLCNAVQERDSEGARRLIVEHIRYFYRYVLASRGGKDVILGMRPEQGPGA